MQKTSVRQQLFFFLSQTSLAGCMLLFLLPSCSSTRMIAASLRDTLPPQPESVISIPVKIWAKPFLDKAETLAPPEFASTQWPNYTPYGCDFRYKYRFVRSALKFSCINNQILISVTGNYQVAGSKSVCVMGKQVAPWINGSCGFNGEPLRRVEVTIGSAVRFLPNYTMRSRSVVRSVNPVDKCSVTFLNTDITDMVMSTVRSSMNEFAASLDHDIAALTISPVIRKIEAGVRRNIVLNRYGVLSANLSSFKIGPLSYSGDTISMKAGLTCFPRLASTNAASPGSALPQLVNEEVPEGFALYANARYDYPFISRLLSLAVQQKTFPIRGESIRIDSLAVQAIGNRQVELKARFSGSRRGVIYLTGTPVLDSVRQIISVPDLNFSLRSRSFVLNAGKTFFNKRILRMLRSQAVINIPRLYSQHKAELDQALQHRFAPNIYSTGTTTRLTLTGLVITNDQLLLQASLKGHAALVVTGL